MLWFSNFLWWPFCWQCFVLKHLLHACDLLNRQVSIWSVIFILHQDSINSVNKFVYWSLKIFYLSDTRYYKKAFRGLFVLSHDNVDGESVVANSPDYISNCHHFGWLLFLALRVHAFSRFKDLVTCTNGLVSILVSETSS